MIRFYKDGDSMGKGTDCCDEDSFLGQVATALDNMIEEKSFEHDWAFQFNLWLPQIVDI